MSSAWRQVVILISTGHTNMQSCSREIFRSLIESNWNQIICTIFRLIWNSKRTQCVLFFQINRKMVNTIWYRFHLIRFRKDFSVCAQPVPCECGAYIFFSTFLLMFYFLLGWDEMHTLIIYGWKYYLWIKMHWNRNVFSLSLVASYSSNIFKATLGNIQYI